MHEVLTNYTSVHKSVLAHLGQVPAEILPGNNNIFKPESVANPQSSLQVSSDIDCYVAVAINTVNNMDQGERFTLAQKIYNSAPALFVNSAKSPASNDTTATDAASDPYAILDKLSGNSSINLMALLLLLVSQYLLPEQLKVADEELQVTRLISQSTAKAVNINAVGQIANLQNAYDKAMSGAETSITASYVALGFAGYQAFTGFAGALKENRNVETIKLENSFHDMKNISEESHVLNADAIDVAGKDGLTKLPGKDKFGLSESEQTELAQKRLDTDNRLAANETTYKNISKEKEARQEDIKNLIKEPNPKYKGIKEPKLDYKGINTLRKALDADNTGFKASNASATSVKKLNAEVEDLKKYSPTLDQTRELFDDATIDKFCQENNTFSVIRKIPDGSIAFLSCDDDFIQTGKVNVYSIAAGSIESHTPFEIDIENRSSVSKIINSQWENKAYLASHGNEVSSILGGTFEEDIEVPQWLSGDEGFPLFSKKLLFNAHEAENLRVIADSEDKVAGKIKEFADEIGKNYPLEHHMPSKLRNLTKIYEHDNMHQGKLYHVASTVSQSLSQAISGYAQGMAAMANANADLLRGLAQILSSISSFNQQSNQQLLDTLTRNISDIISSVFGFVQAVYQTEARVTSTR